jgi:hypothetical protein
MAKEVSRNFRPEHRDVEVCYLDDFGVQKFLYVGLSGPVVVNVDAVIHKHLSQEGRLAENVRLALNPQPAPLESPVVEPQPPPAAAEAAKPPEPMPPKVEAPIGRKRKKAKK